MNNNVEILDLCCDLLSTGNVRSYIDFFNFSSTLDLDSDELQDVQQSLMNAENDLDQANYDSAYEIWKELGHFFQARENLKEAAHMYEKCKLIAETKSQKLEHLTQAYLKLGLTYELLNKLDKSIENHLLHIKSCEKFGNDIKTMEAFNYLQKVYCLKGDKAKREQQYDRTLEMFDFAIEATKNGHNMLEEGYIWYKMGEIYDLKNKADDAIQCYKKFLKISLELENTEAEAKSYFALGNSYKKQGDAILAHKYMESYLSLAKEGSNILDKCQAENAIGGILSDLKKYSEAVEHLKPNYDMCVELGVKEMIEEASINLGVVNGRLQFKQFTDLISDSEKNKETIINWRNSRKSFLELEEKAQRTEE